MGIELQYVEVLGSRMAYRSFGRGSHTVVFVHGVPTSSYIWRNIMNQMPDGVRCIAPDLIGMGDSDKPDIDYTIHDHIKYFEGFMDQVCSGQYSLVLHGWGSVIGFDYAKKHQGALSGIAFYESYIQAVNHWDGLSLPVQELVSDLSGDDCRSMVIDQNYLVEHFLPSGVMGGLNPDVHEVYRRPFTEKSSRKVLLQYVNEAPIGRPKSVSLGVIKAYEQVIPSLDVPKLMIFAVPGFTATMEAVAWCRNYMRNLTLLDLGEAYHFAQETCPGRFGKGLSNWLDAEVLTKTI
ncbi:MAG: haloalkane dehalogenase [Candidatus Comchoanobacterales bacterium]